MSDELSEFKGIVVALQANFLEVEIVSPKYARLLCTRRSRLDYHGSFVNVGDFVRLESIDWKESRAVISDVAPRESWLSRPPVANVTVIVVTLSLKHPTFDLDQASRFLLTAEQTGLDVGLLLTKSDLISCNQIQTQLTRLQKWGYKPLAVSARTGAGLQLVNDLLKGSQIAVFCGPSGVGKSSLLNKLLPEESIRVGELSGRLQRGRHTTRHVELFSISSGTRVADTPGFNRPEIDIAPQNLACLFPEVRSQLKLGSCKFRNCLHINEPGCAIAKNWERYFFYKTLVGQLINSRH